MWRQIGHLESKREVGFGLVDESVCHGYRVSVVQARGMLQDEVVRGLGCGHDDCLHLGSEHHVLRDVHTHTHTKEVSVLGQAGPVEVSCFSTLLGNGTPYGITIKSPIRRGGAP